MTEIQMLGCIAILVLIANWLLWELLGKADAILAHLKGIDGKTITAVSDVGASLSRSDLVEWGIEQENLKKQETQENFI